MASWLERYRNAIIIGLAALLAAAVVALILEQRAGRQSLEINLGEPTPGAGGPIQVYITGAVARPGVYEMTDGDRVVDVLNEAGGFTPKANPEAINLAQRLHDEDQIIVPRLGEPTSAVSGVATAAVNINAATAAELDAALPGIGEVYSQRIVESRTRDGPFTTTEELVERQLIPRATYERIRDLITVGR